MKIESTSFGSIVIDGREYNHDVVIIKDDIRRRDKSLARRTFGTSHRIGRDELWPLIQSTTRTFFLGTGQTDQVKVTEKALKLLEEHGVELIQLPTPKIIEKINASDAEGRIAIIHITC